MPSDLWSFTLDVYARPGVEQACLALQANGANVCMLLCGAWLMQRGVECSSHRLLEIGQLARPWDEAVVSPLRQLRTHWRDAAQLDRPLALLREQVKALELAAEQELISRLEAVCQNWGTAEKSADQPDWLTELAGDAARQNRDALQMLRVATNRP
ncbi:alginate regulatory protein AlgP [Paucimonas lemoignei]|nr:alginate regulatory protein AlgP [Paucimonas lemoignei]